MKKLLIPFVALFCFGKLIAQPAAPSCPTQSIYAHNGTIINGHTLPNGPATIVLNNLPGGAGGLAIGPAFGFPAPNPTWWTTSGGTYWYYNNGGTWSNTGNAVVGGGAVNIGGGATKIYNLIGASGQIWQYTGAGPGTLLTTLVPAFSGQGPYDVVCDMADNFYILKASPGAQQGIYCYNINGVLTCSWSISGMINQTAGGGFSILTTTNPAIHRMYYNSNGTDYIGNIIPGQANIISTVQALPGGGDYACCALPIPTGSIIAPNGGTLTCNLPQIPLVAQVNGNASLGWTGGYNTPTTAPVSPTCGTINWAGPGIVSGQGTPTIQVNQPGVYSYTLFGCNGCPGYTITATFTVIGQGGLMVPIITAPTCFTGPSTMSVSPNNFTNTVLWSGPGIVGPNNTFTINFNLPGTYTAVVSSGTNCSGTGTVYVSPSPTVTGIASPTIICNGGSSSLTASGAGVGGTYTWDPGAIPGSTLVVSPTVSTIYTVTGTSSVGCTGTGTVLVNVGITPTIIATPSPSAICIGNSANVTLSGAANYTTTPGGFLTNFFNVAPMVTTNYNVLGTSVDGCTNTANFQIIVNPLPTVTVNSPTICSGQPLNLLAQGAATYSWTGPQGFTSNLPNPVIPNAQPNMTGQYFVNALSIDGCTGTAVANVSIIPVPAPVIIGDIPCYGGTLNLSGSGALSYTWTGPNGFYSNLPAVSIPSVTQLEAGVYTLSVSIGFCTSFATYDATVRALPIPTLTTNAPVCAKSPMMISGTGGLSYVWYGPNNFSHVGNNINVNAYMTHVGTFTAVVTDNFGCVGSNTIAISVYPLPFVGTIGSTVCANKTATLVAAGGVTYSWTGPGGFTASTGTTYIPNASPIHMGEYSVTVTDINNCVNTGVVQLSVNPMPTVTANYSGPICAGKNIQLNASAQNALLYSWNGPLNFLSVLQNPPLENLQPNASGIYTVFVHDAIGCEAYAFVEVLVRPLPNLNITSDKLESCVPLCINLGQQTFNQIVSTNWHLGNGAVGNGSVAANCFTKPGHYVIYANYMDNYGCENTSSIAVNAWPIPVADFNFTPTKPIINESIEFTDASREAEITNWTWNFSHLSTKPYFSSVVNLSYSDPGSYAAALIVKSNHGCIDTVVKSLIVGDDFGIYVPDVFSPNGDGINDVFQPKGFGINQYEMHIFDRWGERLFSTTDFEQGWNGTYAKRGSEILKQDVYVWKIKLVNTFGKSKEFTGKVTLIK
ncbi:MAG: gliding motility-associated C-terminal domain-containing protein [Sphingobacteriaceae bacterium]|nr:gliding motility-associated C-terminal domain-containing protein [Sphingobacteriaceae bacterium]